MNCPVFLESRTGAPCDYFNGCDSLKRICAEIIPLSSCFRETIAILCCILVFMEYFKQLNTQCPFRAFHSRDLFFDLIEVK